MEWKLKVSKILHVYWGTDPLPFLRFNTVSSFLKLNPDWKIMLWVPKFPHSVVTWTTRELNYEKKWTDYLPDLLELPIEKTYFDMETIGIQNNISEVHKSDFIRFWVLNKYGGVWSDMDIVYFKPMNEIYVNGTDKETYVCISHYGHSNGFFMSAPGSEFFGNMFINAKKNWEPDKFQSNGPDACNKYYPTIESIPNACNLSMDVVYAHDGQHIPDLYNGSKGRFTDRSIGCHWYGGHPLSGEFLRNTDGGLVNLPNNIIGNLCKGL